MRLPDKLIGFNVFKGNRFLGVADVTLPTLEYMTETLSGGGIAGETETPALGQLSSMTISLNFRALSEEITSFIEPAGTLLNCRGSLQKYDSATGKIIPYPCSLTVSVLPKSVELGKFEVGAATDTSIEQEITYLKLYIDNKEICEIDKLNYICRIGGKDYLEEVRDQIGM